MANTLVQFYVEETARIKAVRICEKLGIDLPSYLRMCMLRLIQENGVPFSMKVDEISENRADFKPNATTIAAMEETDEMIRTGNGQHFEGSTEELFSQILE